MICFLSQLVVSPWCTIAVEKKYDLFICQECRDVTLLGGKFCLFVDIVHKWCISGPEQEINKCCRQVLFLFQVVLLSATMPTEVLEVTKKFMREPIRILVKKEELTLEGIKQFYINVEREVSTKMTSNHKGHKVRVAS